MSTLEEVTGHARRELAKVIVGQAEMVDLLLLTFVCGGHALLEGVPGLAKTLAIRDARPHHAPAVSARAVHARSDARRHRRRQRLQHGDERVHAAPGAGVHRLAARRRNQPDAAADAGGAARSDGGAAGHDRRHEPSTLAVVYRLRDAEPGRVRGNVSAAGSRARSLPRQNPSGVSGSRVAARRKRFSSATIAGSTRARSTSSSSNRSMRPSSSRRHAGEVAGGRGRDAALHLHRGHRAAHAANGRR